MEAGERIVVGVNRYQDEQLVAPAIQRIAPEAEAEQVERLQRVRATRDASRWAAAMDRLGTIAAGTDNLVPAIIEAVDANATLGEISDRLRVAWGEHRELITV